MQPGERQPPGREVVHREPTVRLNDDWLGLRIEGLGVDVIGAPLTPDDRVGAEASRLAEDADRRDGLARPRGAYNHGILWRQAVALAVKSTTADEIAVQPVENELRIFQMTDR